MTKQENLDADIAFITSFMKESSFSYEIFREQFRALWTAAALKFGLVPDTAQYDALELRIWGTIEANGEGKNWASYEDFSNFMCKFLV